MIGANGRHNSCNKSTATGEGESVDEQCRAERSREFRKEQLHIKLYKAVMKCFQTSVHRHRRTARLGQPQHEDCCACCFPLSPKPPPPLAASRLGVSRICSSGSGRDGGVP